MCDDRYSGTALPYFRAADVYCHDGRGNYSVSRRSARGKSSITGIQKALVWNGWIAAER